MKKIYLIFYLLITTLAYSFHIMPDGFEKRVDNGEGYQEFYFPNNSLETIRYKFSVSPGSDIRKDLSPWVELYPKVLTIKPGDIGILKIFAKTPKDSPVGEYGFHLNCVPVDIPTEEKNEKNIVATSGVKINASLELIGYSGDIPPIIKLEEYKILEENGKTKILLKLKNISKDRGVELGLVVNGKNKKVVRKSLGRIYDKQMKMYEVELEGMKKNEPYQLIIYEDYSHQELYKTKLIVSNNK